MSSENSASIFNTLSDLPSQLEDGAVVLGEAVRLTGSLSQDTLDAQRHKHLAYILAEQTQLNSNTTHTLNASLNKVTTHPLKTVIVFMKPFCMTCTPFLGVEMFCTLLMLVLSQLPCWVCCMSLLPSNTVLMICTNWTGVAVEPWGTESCELKSQHC